MRGTPRCSSGTRTCTSSRAADPLGGFVVQEETVTGRAGHESHVAVYQVEDDVIVRERLIA